MLAILKSNLNLDENFTLKLKLRLAISSFCCHSLSQLNILFFLSFFFKVQILICKWCSYYITTSCATNFFVTKRGEKKAISHDSLPSSKHKRTVYATMISTTIQVWCSCIISFRLAFGSSFLLNHNYNQVSIRVSLATELFLASSNLSSHMSHFLMMIIEAGRLPIGVNQVALPMIEIWWPINTKKFIELHFNFSSETFEKRLPLPDPKTN